MCMTSYVSQKIIIGKDGFKCRLNWASLMVCLRIVATVPILDQGALLLSKPHQYETEECYYKAEVGKAQKKFQSPPYNSFDLQTFFFE